MLAPGDSKLLTERFPPPKYPVGFLCLLFGHKLGAFLRREGGEYNTRKGNKPAVSVRF